MLACYTDCRPAISVKLWARIYQELGLPNRVMAAVRRPVEYSLLAVVQVEVTVGGHSGHH